ncbi:MAG: 30S ribosomal protein S6 [Saprospiraceae bacterium]|nr:30S ribosomal protein S6 [Saprospiraceae bacterium]
MKNYEVTFIVDPVLSGDEIKATAQTYVDLLKNEHCNIVNVDEMGLKQLAYTINKRQSGVYYCIEFESSNGEFMGNLDLSLRRDERIMRFLTVALDKYGVKYNDDKRKGLIGKKKHEGRKHETEQVRERETRQTPRPPAPKPAPPAASVVTPPVVETETKLEDE